MSEGVTKRYHQRMAWQYVPPQDGMSVRYRGGRYPVGSFIVPAEIEAVFDRPDSLPHVVTLRIAVTFARRVAPEVVEVNVRRRDGGAPVVTSDLRFPLADLAREAVRAATMVTTTPSTGRAATGADDGDLKRQLDHRQSHTREFLEEVAAVHREGELLDRPVMHVAEHWGVNRPTAKKWVRRARDEGVLIDDEIVPNAAGDAIDEIPAPAAPPICQAHGQPIGESGCPACVEEYAHRFRIPEDRNFCLAHRWYTGDWCPRCGAPPEDLGHVTSAAELAAITEQGYAEEAGS